MTLTELKSQVDIVSVMEKLGIKVDNQGKCKCPFHADKNPSMQASRQKQITTCFSSNCNAGTMDVFDFVGKMLSFNVHESAKWLTESFSIVEQKAKPVLLSTPTSTNRIAVLKEAFNYFRNGYQLRKSNAGRIYIASRNIDVQALENAGITLGYNSAQFHHRDRFSTADKQAFCEVGLLKETDHSKTGIGFTPWAAHCVIFPLKNKQGEIVSLYGRSTKWESHFYLTNRQGLFPKYPSSTGKKLILTESIIDACTLLQYPNLTHDFEILALYGVNGFSGCHHEAIKDMQTLEEIILFLDGDTAGHTAVTKIATELNGQHNHLKISKIETPQNEDANSLLSGHSASIFNNLLENRVVLFASKAQESFVEKSNSSLIVDNPNNLFFSGITAHYEVKGGVKKNGLDSLKITLQTHNIENNRKFRDKLDLYEHKHILKYCKEAQEVVCLEKEQIETDLHLLTDLLDNYREQLSENGQKKQYKNDLKATLTKEELTQAETFGRSPNLMQAINDRIAQSGVVGEEKNRLFLFVVAFSHLMENPLNVIVQGNSGSGKSHLIKKISHLVPQDRVKRYTRLSEKVLFNFGEYDLCNTLIVIEDYDGIGEEAEYAVRELQSNRILISGVSSKDEKSGDINQTDKTVRGPIASMVATTKGEVYQDNATRVFFVAVDESKEQTERIIAYKNQLSAGEINPTTQQEQTAFLQKFVCSLQSYKVKNPFLKNITLPVSHHQLRRLHELFTAFCEQITLLHQKIRSISPAGELIAQKEDLQIAIDLMFDSIVLKVDELDGALREFYEQLKTYIKSKGSEEYAFTQREIRLKFLISQSTVYRYMESLLNLEYIEKSYTGKSNTHHYQITFWDDNKALKERIKKDLQEQLDKL